MNFKKYKELSPRTLPNLSTIYGLDYSIKNAELAEASDLAHMSLGIHSETEELISALRNKDSVNIGEELADKVWYISGMIFLLKGRPFELNYTFLNQAGITKDNQKYVFRITKTSSQIADLIKKHLAYRRKLDLLQLKMFLVELLKQITLLASSHGIDMNEQLDKNIRKLYVRYPEKFDISNAVIRDLDKELEELQN